MSKAKAPSLLLLIYEDAGTVGEDWITKDEIISEARAENYMNRVVGWIISEDATTIVIAAQEAMHPDKPMWDLVMRIPKSLIRSRKTIRV